MAARGTVDLIWRKSSYSDGAGGECVEVAVRDSKNLAAGTLAFSALTWAQFVTDLGR